MLNNIKIDQCTITLTRNCNLRCNFCYAKQTGYIQKDEIEYENLKRLVDFCDESDVKYIVFTGGEPSLYPKFIDILKYIKTRKNNIIPTIATNGILLDNFSFCQDLVDNGLGYIDISLKGKDSKETVGYDCYPQQMNAIRNLSVLPIEFTCSMVITPENVNTFCEAIKAACDNGAKQFSFTFIIDNEKSLEKDSEYIEKHNPFTLIESFVSQIDKLNTITKEWWIEYSFPTCIYTEEQLSLLKGKFAAPCQIHKKNGITFDTKMNLLPCNMYIENKIGQFSEDFSSYAEFIAHTERAQYKDTIDDLNKFPSTKCSLCEHLELCYGGCPIIWKNYSFESLEEFKKSNN